MSLTNSDDSHSDGDEAEENDQGDHMDIESEADTEVTKAPCSADECPTEVVISSESEFHTAPIRLLLVSSKIKNSSIIQSATLSNVVFVQYKYDSSTLEFCLGQISQHLGCRKVESVAMVLYCSHLGIHITGKDDKILSRETLQEGEAVREFFLSIINTHMVGKDSCLARLDILACSFAQTEEVELIAKDLEDITGIVVTLSKDIFGCEIVQKNGKESQKILHVGDLYFQPRKILSWSGHIQSMSGFEKIRMVGKGAYGTAVLYRKKDDDSLVILKEINLHDLNVTERQLAQNEVRVLAMLDHPNIIGYYDSFEADGILMIEMEYADGGTLAQFLSQQEKPLPEKDILYKFSQIVSGIKYIHQHNVLHRDLKTDNIFLTKKGVVKIGDFGISKLMSTTNAGNAQTVLGTPYYISPEMCEGKSYNDKSDIWALGCILYEFACLQKTFDGSNLPALVNKIMKGQFAPIKGSYSEDLKTLMMDMLQRQPENRPSAAELCNTRLPQIMKQYDDLNGEEPLGLSEIHSAKADLARKPRSVLYHFQMSSMNLSPVALPWKVKIHNKVSTGELQTNLAYSTNSLNVPRHLYKLPRPMPFIHSSSTTSRQVSVGSDHVVVVTGDCMVYSWGEGGKGQLGHGTFDSKTKPTLVEALKGKSVIRSCCGDGFSIFASDNGIVMTCGDGTYGCLGHGDWFPATRPRLIEALLSVDVVSIACGSRHVAAVGSDGEVYTWGNGANGRLGLGSEVNYCQPMEVSFSEKVFVRSCRCGSDGTMLLTDERSLLACGNNEYNKLGLNQRQGFLMSMKLRFNKCEVASEKVFTIVRSLARHRVIDISMGPYHSSVIVEPGHVYTFGRNVEGQLGTGNTKPQNAPIEIKFFQQQLAFRVICSELCTIAGTNDNGLLFWGSRSSQDGGTKAEPTSPKHHCRNPSNVSISDGNSSASSTTAGNKPGNTGSPAPNSIGTSREKEGSGNKEEFDIAFHPTPLLLLKMETSGSQPLSGSPTHTVILNDFFGQAENLYVLVETTAPPPKRRSRRKRSLSRKKALAEQVVVTPGERHLSVSSHDGGDEYSSEASELDKSKTIPLWLQKELMLSCDSQQVDSNEPDESSDDDDSTLCRSTAIPSTNFDTDSPPMDGSNVEDIEDSNETGIVQMEKAEIVRDQFRVPSSSQGVKQKSTLSESSIKSGSRQDPLGRIRALAKTKRHEAFTDASPSNLDIRQRRESLVLLQSELEEMKKEKLSTEDRLKSMEKQHEKMAVKCKSSERELLLEKEILTLKAELSKQSSQLQDNYNVVAALKEQLNKIQLDQQRINQADRKVQPPQQQQKAPQQKESSRICLIQ